MITGASERRSSCGSAAGDEHDALRRTARGATQGLRVQAVSLAVSRDSRDNRGVRRPSVCHVPDPSSVDSVVAHSIKLVRTPARSPSPA